MKKLNINTMDGGELLVWLGRINPFLEFEEIKDIHNCIARLIVNPRDIKQREQFLKEFEFITFEDGCFYLNIEQAPCSAGFWAFQNDDNCVVTQEVYWIHKGKSPELVFDNGNDFEIPVISVPVNKWIARLF